MKLYITSFLICCFYLLFLCKLSCVNIATEGGRVGERGRGGEHLFVSMLSLYVLFPV